MGVCTGGTLALWASWRGACGLHASAASRAFRPCTSVHKALMRASCSDADKRSSSGSLSLTPLSWSQRAAVKKFYEGVEQLPNRLHGLGLSDGSVPSAWYNGTTETTGRLQEAIERC